MKELLIILDGLMEKEFEENIGETITGEYYNMFTLEKSSYCTEGYVVDSLNCIMNILGYPPDKYDLSDRAYYEGLSRGLNKYSSIMRCNVVKIKDGILEDFTGGELPSNIGDLVNNFPISEGKAVSCLGYKNLVYFYNKKLDRGEGLCPPHFNIGCKIEDIIGNSPDIDNILKDSMGYFKLKGYKGLGLWPWGVSHKPSFKKYHRDTGLICGIDLVHGIGIHLGMDSIKVQGATGDIDSNILGKLIETKLSIEKNNRTILHINGFDESSHRRDLNVKKAFINRVREQVILPLIKQSISDNIDIYITIDHRTDSKTGQHERGWVPILKLKL
ncbi:MAG: hypothetical protein RSB66_04640 [Clostridium sp.]